MHQYTQLQSNDPHEEPHIENADTIKLQTIIGNNKNSNLMMNGVVIHNFPSSFIGWAVIHTKCSSEPPGFLLPSMVVRE